VGVEKQLFAGEVGFRFVDAKDPGAFAVEISVSNEVVDCSTGLEGRIQLKQGFRPKCTGVQFGIDFGEDGRVGDLDEAFGIACVVAHQSLP
jgi:hypothetical protein